MSRQFSIKPGGCKMFFFPVNKFHGNMVQWNVTDRKLFSQRAIQLEYFSPESSSDNFFRVCTLFIITHHENYTGNRQVASKYQLRPYCLFPGFVIFFICFYARKWFNTNEKLKLTTNRNKISPFLSSWILCGILSKDTYLI